LQISNSKSIYPSTYANPAQKRDLRFFMQKWIDEGTLIPAVPAGCTLKIESAAGEIPGAV
jgi:hypothetical protein